MRFRTNHCVRLLRNSTLVVFILFMTPLLSSNMAHALTPEEIVCQGIYGNTEGKKFLKCMIQSGAATACHHAKWFKIDVYKRTKLWTSITKKKRAEKREARSAADQLVRDNC